MIVAGTTADIQAMILALPNDGSYLRVPPGEYTGGAFHITGKNSEEGARTVIDMDGVYFSGTGVVTIDSCKYLTLRSLRAPDFDIYVKGMWRSHIDHVDVKSHVYCGPGTAFSSSYWNTVTGGTIKRIVFHETMASPANANLYEGVAIDARGFDYAIEFRANKSVKGLRFLGGDISYATIADWKIGGFNTEAGINCIGYGNYFDSGRGAPATRDTNDPRRLIKWYDPVYWG